MDLLNIKNPDFLRDFSIEEIENLAQDIRSFLYENIAKTGGHLASNLGIVELTLALHYVFKSPVDKLIFDIGHQSYVHKILTGRAKDFETLRQFNGLSGYQSKIESKHDVWEARHASTAISAALGMAIARDLNKEEYNIISIVGDKSIVNGMSFDALNHLALEKKKVIIVFNDNNINKSNNIGGISKVLNHLRLSKPYTNVKKDLSINLSKNKVGDAVLSSLKSIKTTVKKNVLEDSIFSEIGLDYIGPIDGHNIKELISTFEYAKNNTRPIVLHIITKKGKGIEYCENDKSDLWHKVGQFNPDTGEMLSELENNHYTWSEAISRTLVELAKNDNDIVAITPGSLKESKLVVFEKYFPHKTFDTGIAEGHATTLAAALAASNKKPFLSIYSTFLQKAYDQINDDIARLNLPVVIGVNYSGIVGGDGSSFQGIFDISLLNSIPNMIIVQAKDMIEAQNLLYSSFYYNQPVAIRYPKASTFYKALKTYKIIEKGTWTKAYWPQRVEAILIAYGPDVDKFISKIQANSLNVGVINARFIKPLDKNLLFEIAKINVDIFTYENEILNGGLSSQIINFYSDNNIKVNINRFGIDDKYIQHGSIQTLRKHYNLDVNYVLKTIKDFKTKE